MTVAAAAVLALLVLAAGDGVLAAGGDRAPWRGNADSRAPLAFAAGLLVLHLLLLAAALAGIPWTRSSILALLGAAAIAGLGVRLRSRDRPRAAAPSARPGPGDLVAAGGLATFAGLTATGWLIFPDLVYHWGIKAGKFVLERGIDLDLLTRPADFALHPDYPLLLTDLVAATSLVSGVDGPGAGMVWGPVFATAAFLAARSWLAESFASRLTLQLAVAAVGLYLAFSAVAFRRATDAGWLLALALLLAAPALARSSPREGDDLRVGLAAALAAAAKLEGLPLAFFLVAAAAGPGLARRLRGRSREPADGAPRLRWPALLLPPAAVALPWLALVAHHGLFADTHWSWSRVGPERFATVPRAMLESATQPLWLGFGVLTLVLLIVPWLTPSLHRLGAVLTLQLGVYAAAYLATPLGVEHLVETSFDRLLGHLTPVALAAALVAADRWARGRESRTPGD